MSVQISMSECPGAWITNGPGDVHVYAKDGQVVIGANKSYKDKIEFTDLAVVIGAEKCFLQYACDGKAKQIDVPEKIVKDWLLHMLAEMKEMVV